MKDDNRNNKPKSDRLRTERKPYSGDRKPYNGDHKPYADRKVGDKPRFDQASGEHKSYDKDRRPRPDRAGKPHTDRRPRTEGRSFDGPRSDEGKSFERKPRTNQPHDKRNDGGYAPRKSHSGERKPYSGERKPFNDERRSYRSDRPASKGKSTPKEDLLRVTISKLDDDYAGVAYVGAKRYVVKGALPEETVLVRKGEVFGQVTLCSLVKVLEESEERVAVDCPYYQRCGGCDLRHVDTAVQCELKRAFVRRKLLSVLPDGVEVRPTVPAEGLRNKVHWVWGTTREGRITLGFFNSDTHAVIDAPECPQHGRWYAPVAGTLRRWAERTRNIPYDPITGKGTLRFVVARRLTSGLLVTIVATGEVKGLDSLYTDLCKLGDHVGLWLNLNTARTNEVFGERFAHVAGETKLSSSMLSVPFALAPNSFFQTNTQIATLIYRDVCDFVAPPTTEDETVLDLYSGIGITSALFAKRGYSVVSVESSSSATEDAVDTAARSGVLDKLAIHTGDVATVLPTIKAANLTAIFVDPPRAGLGEGVCAGLVKLAAPKLAYLSCNPGTLAADLERLVSVYDIVRVTPYDLFPATKHVETLVLLTKKAGK